MPKIINAFRGTSPVADSISKLGLALFGDSLSTDVKRAQLEALQRENAETSLLGQDVESMGGFDKAAVDPTVQGRIISSGYDPNKFFAGARGSAYASGNPIAEKFYQGAGGAYSGTESAFNTGEANENMRAANTLAEANRHNVAGEGLDRDKFGWEKDKFWQEPQAALVNGQPAFAPRGRLTDTGTAPIRSETEVKGALLDNQFQYLTPEEQKQVLGANENVGTSRVLRTPQGNYIVTDESYSRGLDSQGNVLPPPSRDDVIGNIEDAGSGVISSPAANTQLDKAEIDFAQFQTTHGMLKDVAARADPRLFGYSGKLLDAGRGAITLGSNVWGLLAGAPDAGSAKQKIEAEIQASIGRGNTSLSPDVFNVMFSPDGGELETLAGVYLYKAAAAIAGQAGRDLSNADVTRMLEIFGSPQSWSVDKDRFNQKIDLINRFTINSINGMRQLRGKPQIPMPAGDPTSPEAGVPGVAPIGTPPPQPAPAAGAAEVWERGPDGVPRRVQ